MDAKKAFRDVPKVSVESGLPDWIVLRIAPDMDVKRQVVHFLRGHLSDLQDELCDKLALAIDELLGNAMEHGCHSSPKSAVDLSVIRTARTLICHIRDCGPGFSLAAMDHAAVNNPPGEPLRHTEFRSQAGMRPGGFGIMLVKQIADELLYNEAGNEVMLIKYLASEGVNGNGHHS